MDFYDADEVIGALKARGLLFDSDDTPYPGYRSRMAETVRLAFRLRQLFPQHQGLDGWQQGRTLVADFRFTRRRRRYPRRDLEFDGGHRRDGHTALRIPRCPPLLAGFDRRARGEHYRTGGVPSTGNSAHSGRSGARGASTGTLVSAGTGSGKTLAFYLPAMARVGMLRVTQGRGAGWVKLLAIYPRNELLRDQFAEVYAEARRLDRLLQARGAGKIRIGALFGETPEKAAWLTALRTTQGWRATTDGQGLQLHALPAARLRRRTRLAQRRSRTRPGAVDLRPLRPRHPRRRTRAYSRTDADGSAGHPVHDHRDAEPAVVGYGQPAPCSACVPAPPVRRRWCYSMRCTPTQAITVPRSVTCCAAGDTWCTHPSPSSVCRQRFRTAFAFSPASRVSRKTRWKRSLLAQGHGR